MSKPQATSEKPAELTARVIKHIGKLTPNMVVKGPTSEIEELVEKGILDTDPAAVEYCAVESRKVNEAAIANGGKAVEFKHVKLEPSLLEAD